MIYWHGKGYQLVTHPYNGPVLGYLLDGVLVERQPKRTKVKGHILTEDGAVIVLGRDLRVVLVLLLAVLVAIAILLWPRYEYIDYQVTFAEWPVLRDGIIYCNVINEADIEVTVQFLGDDNKSSIYHLQPGDTLPYIHIDFVPTTIRYNGRSDFQLEVQND